MVAKNLAKQNFCSIIQAPTHFSSEQTLLNQCRYHNQHYHDDYFSQFGIEFPVSLKRAVNKRKAEFLAGRLCAQNLLQQLSYENFPVVADNNRCPLFPEGLKGSITHTDTMALCAISSKPDLKGIGIDLEVIVAEKTRQDISSQIIFGDEASWLNHGDFEPGEMFSLIFSAKESFFKAAYPQTNCYFGFECAKLVAVDPKNSRFQLSVCQDLSAELARGKIVNGEFCWIDGQILTLIELQ